MEITDTYKASDRSDWRNWLYENHATKKEIWLLYDDRINVSTVSYLDSVEEAICFVWIDGIQKQRNKLEKAKRFTPRKKKSNWTELNKERARALIKKGVMTEHGKLVLLDLDSMFIVPEHILERLKCDPKVFQNFNKLPELYIRIRIGYIDEMRNKPDELEKRLTNFIKKTHDGILFGNWNDHGRLGSSHDQEMKYGSSNVI